MMGARAMRNARNGAGRKAMPAALLLALLIIIPSALRAQDDTLRTRYGIIGGYSLNMHRADFRALPGVPNCCPQFEQGSGGGAVGGLLIEFPLASSFLLSLQGSYVAHDALLTQREPVAVIVNGAMRDGAFEHRVDAAISTIGLEPSVGVRVAGDLFLHLGLRAGFYLAGSYEQEERIVDPVDVGTYLDANGGDTRRRVRNQTSGDLPDAASFLLQGVGGIGYELPLNSRRTLLLKPEISYALSFTDVVSGLEWKPNGLRAGIALKYSPAPEPPKPIRYDTLIVSDTTTRETREVTAERITLLRSNATFERLEGLEAITMRTTIRRSYLRELPAPPPMACTLGASGVNDDGVAEPIATLRIEEFLSTVAHPLLHFLFFEPGAATLPERYTLLSPEARSAFDSRELRGAGTLTVYHTLLNIIGERMRKYPQATLTLTGCNMDQGVEKGNLDLSRSRAVTVRDYLVSVWGIDASRLRLDAVNLPVKRSNPLTEDGQAEDRRVEIVASIPEILDVLLIDDTTRTSTPPIVRITPSIIDARGIVAWEVTVAQRGTVLKRFAGTGMPPASLDWDLVNDQEHMPRYSEPLLIRLTASNSEGEKIACSMELPTRVTTVREKRENRVGDYTFDRYNLILFSVGESNISPANQRIIDLVKSRLTPKSEVTVEGFADRTGNPASNKRLSAARAKTTATALGRPDATVRGIGDTRLLHPNDTPEGRFYCRTVQIMVKTEVR